MKLLLIGGGGREHALGWKLAQSPLVTEVFVAPGNPGLLREKKVRGTGLGAGDFTGLAAFCKEQGVEFVVVGPDQALADGAVDYLEARGIAAYGPTRAAATIESSKCFAKTLMKEAGIPTARFELFGSLSGARAFIESVEWGRGWVIKADGLALGKGVVVCESKHEALSTLDAFMKDRALGDAGTQVVIEERLVGRETSGFYLCDGTRAVRLGYACDYKRIHDGDKGPNTGGMGAFAPADWLPAGFEAEVEAKIVQPLLTRMRERGTPFKGTLFVGLMATDRGPQVIEFNARFGDPETQALMPLLDEDLLPWLQAARDGRLDKMPASGPRLKEMASVHVVMAAGGYPGVSVRKGDPISVPPELFTESSERKLFFAGVAEREGELATNGGRVLGLTAVAADRAAARKLAYAEIEKVSFAGAQRRTDVGA